MNIFEMADEGIEFAKKGADYLMKFVDNGGLAFAETVIAMLIEEYCVNTNQDAVKVFKHLYESAKIVNNEFGKYKA